MARILSLDGAELCPLLAFARQGDRVVAQAKAEHEEPLKDLTTEVVFEDDNGRRFRGRITSTARGSRSGAFASSIIKAELRLDVVA